MNIQIPVPYEIQQRAWDRAFVLTQEHADRLTLEQRVRMIVTTMYTPERLGWAEIGEAVTLFSRVVEVRV